MADAEEIFGEKTDRHLQVGDTIALCIQKEGKFYCVASEGFVELSTALREVNLSSTIPWTFIDCQWRVTHKFQYDAHKKLRHHLKVQRRAIGGPEAEPTKGKQDPLTPSTAKRLSAHFQKKKGGMHQAIDTLLREKRTAMAQEMQRQIAADLQSAVDGERTSNNTRNQEKQGTPITYGETFQLMHVKSGKFLVLNPKYRTRNGCFQVRLDPKGSEDSWMSVRPRYKFTHDGALVLHKDSVTLYSAKRQLSLHTGENISTADAERALAAPASAAGTGGVGVDKSGKPEVEDEDEDVEERKAKATADKASEEKRAAEEVNASLSPTAFQLLILASAEKRVAEPADASAKMVADAGDISRDKEKDVMRVGEVIALYHCEQQAHLIAAWGLRQTTVPVVYTRYKSSMAVGSNALWQVQSPNGWSTAPIEQGQGYCLQHLASGKYLTVASGEGATFPLTLVGASVEEAGLFELHDCNCPSKYLPISACIIRLRHAASGGWLGSGLQLEDASAGTRGSGHGVGTAGAEEEGEEEKSYNARKDQADKARLAAVAKAAAEAHSCGGDDAQQPAVLNEKCYMCDGLLVERPSQACTGRAFSAASGAQTSTHRMRNNHASPTVAGVYHVLFGGWRYASAASACTGSHRGRRLEPIRLCCGQQRPALSLRVF